MMLAWRWRSVVTTVVVLAAVFVAAAGVGFLLEHEPAPDERRITIDRRVEPLATDTLLGGEVTNTGGGRIELRTRDGTVELELHPDATVEELLRTAEPRFVPGDAVNLGGEQGDFGVVLTGVVALEPANDAEAAR